jgi:hypothetical protein
MVLGRLRKAASGLLLTSSPPVWKRDGFHYIQVKFKEESSESRSLKNENTIYIFLYIIFHHHIHDRDVQIKKCF